MLNKSIELLNSIFLDLGVSKLSNNERTKLEFSDFLRRTNSTIQYIKSGSTGHTFKGIINPDLYYAIKIVPYTKKKIYGSIKNEKRPENVDILALEMLENIVLSKKTPHLMLPYGCFYSPIEPFINLNISDNKKKFTEFKKKYERNCFHKYVSVLISEWANHGDLHEFVKKKNGMLSTIEWKVIFFHLIFTLAVIQDIYPAFRHNDLKCNNVLIQDISHHYVTNIQYKINDKYVYSVPNTGFQVKIWDFDFTSIGGIIDNIKVDNEWSKDINISKKKNHYYDLHFFFNTLIKKGVCEEILDPEKTSTEIIEFIEFVVPKKYRHENTTESGRLLLDVEHVTPKDILISHSIFDDFKVL